MRPEELVPLGGRWRGLLFDNPAIGLAPALTWEFEFDFAELHRDYGSSPVSLAVEQVPLRGTSWSGMSGATASAEAAGETGIACSVYFFEHYRYDAVRLQVLEQVAGRLRVSVDAHGDLDGLGAPSLAIDQWLEFRGITVQLHDAQDTESAEARLSELTDIAGLAPLGAGPTIKFVESPAGG